MESSQSVADALGAIYAAISEGDAGVLAGALSNKQGVVFIGTDPDEWYEDADEIGEMLKAQAAAGIRVRPGKITAYSEGSVGWASDRGTFVLPDGSEVPFRATVVFHEEDGLWKVVQEHASVGVPNEESVGIEL